MSDLSVDSTRLSDPSYARYCITHGCDAKVRCKIAAIHGADIVTKWESVDTTKYEIDDEDFNNAYNRGQQGAKDKTGYDGHKSYRAVGDAVVDVGANVAGRILLDSAAKEAGVALTKAAGNAVVKAAGKATTKAAAEAAAAQGTKNAAKAAAKESSKAAAEKAAGETAQKSTEKAGEKASFIVGCTLGLATGIKYQASKPNKDQVEAARVLRDEQLPEGQDNLGYTQEMMAESGEEILELTEEAEEANDEANEEIEDKKTLMDYYKAQYNALKAKVESKQQLTPDEKALMKKLTPLMQGTADDINDANEEASDTVNEIYSDIEDHQDVYDESAETIAEVQGVTDYAEGFDQNTQTMCYVEGGVQTLNAGLTGISAYKAASFASSGGWTTAWAWAFAAMGATGAALSGAGAAEQFKWAGEVGQEIDVRESTQELGDVTQEAYDTEVENFAGSMEFIDDLEIEIPEDMEVPEEITEESSDSTGGTTGTDAANGTNGIDGTNGNTGVNGNNNTGNSNGGVNGTGNNQNGTSPSGLPNSKDPNYVNNMGTGSDWHEVASGNIKRDSDDDIVKDGSGKVVLLNKYCETITSVTGAKEGEYFSKDDIPAILEKLLGDPFDAKTIKKVHNGKKVDSEFAAQILGTKDQDDRGEEKVDNTGKATEIARRVVNFYYGIFEQASKRGWVQG